MTLQELLTLTKAADPEHPLVLATASGPVGDGYHVTEFKLGHMTGIDCGGRVSSWSEASMQVLPSGSYATMEVGKFARILAHSLEAVPGLGDAPLRVEHTPMGQGMQVFEIAAVRKAPSALVVMLSAQASTCKPARDAARLGAPCCAGAAG